MARSTRRTFHIPRPTRQQFLKFAFLALGLWFLSHYFLEVWEYMGVRAEEARWQEAVNQGEMRHAALEQRLDQVRGDPNVEKVAREGLGMAKPGEHVVRPLPYDPADVAASADKEIDGRPTWRQWWDRFFTPDDN
ncbi:MAG: septum formation initiator family protein [Anaerolineae bacterium]|nr:septum formation initiator family protein [Anaerolineae bacterium]